MLQVASYTPAIAGSQDLPSLRVYSSTSIAGTIRWGSATERAFLALALSDMGVPVQQATVLACANRTYVAILRRMTAFERAEVRAGRIKLSDRVTHHRKPISDEEFDALVAERVERAWAVLERLTHPNCEPSLSGEEYVKWPFLILKVRQVCFRLASHRCRPTWSTSPQKIAAAASLRSRGTLRAIS
jgi:hypothetical protein